jgi:hypothetical protein
MARYNSVNSIGSIAGGSTISTPASGLLTTITSAGTTFVPIPALYTGSTQTIYNASGVAITLSTNSNGNFIGAGASGSTTIILANAAIITIVSDGSNYVVQGFQGGPISTTTLSASGAVTFNPTNASISIQPTGTGIVTIASSTGNAGTIDNMNIGATTQGSGKFTSLEASGVTKVTTSTAATLGTTGTGALQVTGGASVGGILNVGSTLYVGGTTNTINATNPTSWVSVDTALTTQSMYMQVNTTSTDTRIGSYTNHKLGIYTNNSLRMTLDTSGNVGIGTATPSALLTTYFTGLYDTATRRYIDIVGDFAGTNAASATNAGAFTGIRFGNSSLAGKYAVIGAVSEDPLGYARTNGLSFWTSIQDTAAAERVRISGSGLVGIGNTTPQYKLDVGIVSGSPQSATAGAGGAIRNASPADSSPYTQARITIYGDTSVDTSNWAYLAYGADAVARFVYAKTGSSAGQLSFGTSSATNGTGTYTEFLRMNNNGLITTPTKPSFYAYDGYSGTQITGTIIYSNCSGNYNRGSYYNTSNGRFTAPVAGWYQFNYSALNYPTVSATSEMWLSINGGGYSPLLRRWGAPSQTTFEGSATMYLSANDYVTVQASTMYVYTAGGHGHFSGFLIG